MKRYSAILVVLILAVFTAGCGLGDGYSYDPGVGAEPPIDDPALPPIDDPQDPPVDDPEDPPADDPIVYRPVGMRDDLVVRLPDNNGGATLSRAGDGNLTFAGSANDDPDVDAPWIDVAWESKPIDCDDFETDEAHRACVGISCDGVENPGACFQGEVHTVECADIYDWISDVPESCDVFSMKEDLCLTERCAEQARRELSECEANRAALGDFILNSGCYADIGDVQDAMEKNAKAIADLADRMNPF